MKQVEHISAFEVIQPGIRDRNSPLPVNPVSQWGYWSACGVACTLMIARAFDRGWADTVSVWEEILDPEHNGIPPYQLAEMLQRLGLTPSIGVQTNFPFCEAIDYGRLPDGNKWPTFRGQSFAHWIVREEGGWYTDPLFPQLNQARFQLPVTLLDAACVYLGTSSFHMRVGVVH